MVTAAKSLKHEMSSPKLSSQARVTVRVPSPQESDQTKTMMNKDIQPVIKEWSHKNSPTGKKSMQLDEL